jgi:hypothetical protein
MKSLSSLASAQSRVLGSGNASSTTQIIRSCLPIAITTLLVIMLGGFPPTTWVILFQTLGQLNALFTYQGPGVILPLTILIVQSLLLLIAWGLLGWVIVREGAYFMTMQSKAELDRLLAFQSAIDPSPMVTKQLHLEQDIAPITDVLRDTQDYAVITGVQDYAMTTGPLAQKQDYPRSTAPLRRGKIDGITTGQLRRGQLDDVTTGQLKRGQLDDVTTGQLKRGQLDDVTTGQLRRGQLDDVTTGQLKRGQLDDVTTGQLRRSKADGMTTGPLRRSKNQDSIDLTTEPLSMTTFLEEEEVAATVWASRGAQSRSMQSSLSARSVRMQSPNTQSPPSVPSKTVQSQPSKTPQFQSANMQSRSMPSKAAPSQSPNMQSRSMPSKAAPSQSPNVQSRRTANSRRAFATVRLSQEDSLENPFEKELPFDPEIDDNRKQQRTRMVAKKQESPQQDEEEAEDDSPFVFGNPFDGPLPDVFQYDTDLKRSVMESQKEEASTGHESKAKGRGAQKTKRT